MGYCYCQIALESVGVSVSLQMKSFCLRAEQPMAPDLLSYRSMFGCSSSSSCNRGLVFIVNPQGANGRTGKEWKKLLPCLRTRLGQDYNVTGIYESLTLGPSYATAITREAIREGANTVIAVGGDGTLHEVVNGFFRGRKAVRNRSKEASHSTALGFSSKNRRPVVYFE